MRKVIEGRRYDTDTAKQVGWYWDKEEGDFFHVEETLYRKRNGEYFLHGKGGAAIARYCQYRPDGSCAGEKIVSLLEDEAKEWAAAHDVALA